MDKPAFAHDVEWNDELISRFWDNRTTEGNYYSDAVGDALIRLAAKATGGLQGRVLDYGCGPGILLEKLAHQGITCEGADPSPDSISAARHRLKQSSFDCPLMQLTRLPSPYADNSFDVVFFVETIEHILPTALPQTLSELLRIVRPGGHVIVTTPNAENLKASETVCPECGARYHKMQHVSRWTAATIANQMERLGWETVRSRATRLPRNTWHCRFKAFLANLIGRKQKHLIYIGRKPLQQTNSLFAKTPASANHGGSRAA